MSLAWSEINSRALLFSDARRGFPGEPLSGKHIEAIEQPAQCLLDARAQFAGSSVDDY
jgi:hypothetical protein